MIDENATNEEYQKQLEENRNKQLEITHALKQSEAIEEAMLNMLTADNKRTELLNLTWTGAAANRYVASVNEENITFQKRYVQAIRDERDYLQSEQKRLCMEEEDITDAIKRNQQQNN